MNPLTTYSKLSISVKNTPKRSFITFWGDPISDMRPRVRRTGFVQIYDPLGSVKKNIREELQSKFLQLPLTGPCAMKAVFYIPMPKAWSGKKRKLKNNTPADNNQDLDNLLKFICDVMNDIVYKDDRQVVYISSCKKYAHEGKTEVYVRNLEG